MKKMRARGEAAFIRAVILLLTLCFAAVCLAGCASKDSTDTAKETKASQTPASVEDIQLPRKSGYIFNTYHNEKGTAFGGEPGDQTGKESHIGPFPRRYKSADYPWTCVLRCTDEQARAEAAKLACADAANRNIGYDSSADGMNSLWEQASLVDGDITKITTPCAANCATSVLTFYRCAGVRLGIDALADIDSNHHVWEMRDVLLATGMFEEIDGESATHSPDNNYAGDIYLAVSKHTIIQVSDGKDVKQK